MGVRVVLLVGAVVLSVGVTPASAVDLDRVPSRAPVITVLGASAAGVLYRVSPEDPVPADQTTWVKPAGAAAYQVPGGFDRLAGTRIFSSVDGSSSVSYQVIGTPVTKPCAVIGQLAAVTTYGWVSADGDRVDIGAGGCQLTAHLPRSWKIVAADETGYVELVDVDSDGTKSLTYRSYADPSHPRVIPDGGYNWWISGLVLSGSAITWTSLERTQPAQRSFVVRAKTDGSPPVRLATENLIVRSTSIAGGSTGWQGCGVEGGCAGGSFDANGTAHRLPDTQSVVSDGTRFVFDTHGSPDAVDAAAAVDATTPRTRIAEIGYLPPVAYAVSLGAGAAAYTDSQLPAFGVNRRGYSRTGSTITLAGQIRVAQTGSAFFWFLSRDGRRTAYVDTGGDLWVATDDGVRTRVFAGEVKTAIVTTGIELSGTRLLWWRATYDGEGCDLVGCFPVYKPAVPMLYNLATGTNSPLTGPVADKPAALWGSYLTYADKANAIWRRDLSSNALVQVKAAGGAPVNDVAVHDDYVAWSTCVPGTSNYCAPSTVAFRNMATKAAAVQITTGSTQHISLSGGHVLFDDYVGNFPQTGNLRVLRLGTTATGLVGVVKAGTRFDVHDETLGWIGADSVARVGANSSFVAPPRFLGNTIGTASFTPSAGPWTPEFPISKALTSCTLTIKSGTTVRRVLTCPTTVGSARPSWNGLDSAGKLVAKGTYSWTLTASDSDGTLRWWTNATHPIAGTVRVV